MDDVRLKILPSFMNHLLPFFCESKVNNRGDMVRAVLSVVEYLAKMTNEEAEDYIVNYVYCGDEG